MNNVGNISKFYDAFFHAPDLFNEKIGGCALIYYKCTMSTFILISNLNNYSLNEGYLEFSIQSVTASMAAINQEKVA